MTSRAKAAEDRLVQRTIDHRVRSRFLEIGVRLIREKPLGLLGAGIVLALLVTAVLANVIAPYGYAQTSLTQRFRASSAEHWLGTDQLGRDLLSRIIYGTRVSLTVISLLGPGLFNVLVVLGLSFGIQNSRIIRGAALSVKENAYIEAAQAFGGSSLRIMLAHMLPNVAAIIIVVATIGLGNLILVEAALSFLGFGVPPPHPTWGGMLSLQGLSYMYQAPWLAIWPGVALSAAVFGFNMFGDALRDLLDPRLRGGQ